MDYSQEAEGKPIPELFTDENGYLKSPELAYGTYVVIESTTPENYETIAPFLVKITKDSRQPQAWRVFYDKEFEAKVKVNKKDIHSSENVLKAGTEYLLYDVRWFVLMLLSELLHDMLRRSYLLKQFCVHSAYRKKYRLRFQFRVLHYSSDN